MCRATRDIMECMFEVCLDATQEPDDIPKTTEPVWILGKKYDPLTGITKNYCYIFIQIPIYRYK